MERFLDSIAPILLGVGLMALWIELKATGVGLPENSKTLDGSRRRN